jgi:CRISPR-associated protein Cmr2
MSHENLLVFSVGPVQGFIAAARKIEDLWSGSYILSYLTEKAILTVLESALSQDIDCEIIYPRININDLIASSTKKNIEVASLPNRFVCRVQGDELQTAAIARQAEQAVGNTLLDMGQFAIKQVFPADSQRDSYMQKLLEVQVDSILEIFWAIEQLKGEKDFARARLQLEKRLAAVKNSRPYQAISQEGLVCTLCGEQQALTFWGQQSAKRDNYRLMKENLLNTWNQRREQFKAPLYQEGDEKVGRIKDGEGLCGICLTKRLARDYFQEKRNARNAFKPFPSTREIAGDKKYYAVIMMDGDDMGKWVSGKQEIPARELDIKYQKELSEKLDRFAVQAVPTIVKEYAGQLIYAGGDDVLAFAPVNSALPMAKALRLAFSSDAMGLGARATASAGVVFAHEKAPLSMVLDYARSMEKRAKAYQYPQGKPKDALGLAVLTHSGEIREAVVPWALDGKQYTGMTEHCAVAYLQELVNMVQRQMSAKFIENFAQAFLPLLGVGLKQNMKISVLTDAAQNRRLMEIEMLRVLKRSAWDECADIDFSTQAKHLIAIHEIMESTLQFVHLMEMSRFFRRMEGKMKQLLLQPVDTFFFRNQKDFKPGEDSTAGSIFPPRPGTIYGALRSAYIHNHSSFTIFSEGSDKDLKDWMGNPQSPGRFSMRGCLLYADNQVLLPLPLDYQVVKTGDANTAEKAYPLLLTHDDVPASDGRDYRLYGVDEGKSSSAAGAFINLTQWKEEILNRQGVDIIRSSQFIEDEHKLGIALDWEKKTAREKMLYQIKMSRFKSQPSAGNGAGFIAVCKEAPSFADVPFLRLGGKNRPWHLKELPDEFCLFSSVEEEQIINQIEESGIARLIMLSPAVWTDKSVFYIREKSRFRVNEYLELPVLAQALGRPILLGGWDIARNAPKPRIQAAPAGTVLYLKVGREQARPLVLALKDAVLSDELGYEGYGWAACGAAIGDDNNKG